MDGIQIVITVCMLCLHKESSKQVSLSEKKWRGGGVEKDAGRGI